MGLYLNDIKNKPDVLFGVLIEIILSIIGCTSNDFEICSYISFFQTVIAIIVIARSGFGIISVPVFFVVLTYIFHCSQFILYTLNIEYSVAFDIVDMVGIEISQRLLTYYIISVIFLTLGFLITTDRTYLFKKKDIFISFDFCSYIGKILMLLCFVPRFYLDISHFISYLIYGYEATYTNEAGLLLVWAYGFYIGALFYILGSKFKKYHVLYVIIFSAYLLITMICGRRLEQTGVLVILFIIYLRYCSRVKIKKTKLLVFAVLAYVFLAIVATMGDMRYSLTFSFDSYWNVFLENLKGKLITGQIAEFGDTGISLAYAIKCFPEDHPYHGGLTYIFAWMQVFPNIGGFVQKYFNTDIAFITDIPSIYLKNFGCSFLGELYYNFGYFGTVASLFIGFFIGKICRRVEWSVNNKLNIKSMMYLAIMPTMITYVRGSFSDFVRIYIYYYIAVYSIYNLSTKYSKGYRIKNELSNRIG